LTVPEFSGERRHASRGGSLLPTKGTEVTEMASTWELMTICIEDAQRAEDLVREVAFRRELRLDPQKALGAFELRAKPVR
jgi:hypothetical protein